MSTSKAGDITRLLQRWKAGDEQAREQVIEGIHLELLNISRAYLHRERANHTLRSNELINEAYIRITKNKALDWSSRKNFLAYCANTMRNCLVDHARSRTAKKRGGHDQVLPLEEGLIPGEEKLPGGLIALDQALTRLEKEHPRQAKVVELKYFAGLTNDEVADVLEVSFETIKRDWRLARAWLFRQLNPRKRL